MPLLLTLLALFLAACQVVITTPVPTLTPTVTATLSPSATPTPTASATASATATATPSPAALGDTALHLRTFDELWSLVEDVYLYPDYNGADWNAVRARYRPLVEAGQSDEAFYNLMWDVMAELGDGHSNFQDPQTVLEEEASLAGNNDYVGIGIYVLAVPDKQRAVILFPFPNSPAEEAGLRAHDSILTVDGQQILDENGDLRDIVRGPDGSTVTLLVQSPGGEPREMSLVRRRITGSVPVESRVILHNGKRIGYIFLPTFADDTVPDKVIGALRALAPLDGLILDDRQNEGGADTNLIATIELFTNGTLGYFVSREDERPLAVGAPSDGAQDVAGSQTVPLVVLIGADTVSYGEVFAGILQDQGRATIIGETTLGNVETMWGYDLPDGSRVWIARESFRPARHPEMDWEHDGIVPDISAPARWEEITPDADPGVQAALDYLTGKP